MTSLATPAEIIAIVGEWAGLSRDELMARRRTRLLAQMRGVAMYLMRQHVAVGNQPLGFAAIGGHFGLDHSTVIYWCDHIAARCQARPAYRAALDRLVARINDERGCAA